MRKYLWLVPLTIIASTSVLATPQLLGRYREFVINHLFVTATPVSAQTIPLSQPADQQIPDALKPPITPEDRSLNIRLNAEWPRAIRSLKKNPLLGTGFSSVGLATDNDYLRALAETGLLGLGAFALIIIRVLRSGIAYLLSPPSDIEPIFITAVTFGLIGLLINAVFIDVFEASKVAIITWTLIGLMEKAKTKSLT